jgi:predicted amidohydrolase
VSSRVVRVRCDELAPAIGDLYRNKQLIEAAVVAAMADGVQLLVLPELSTSGYYLSDPAEALSCSLAPTDEFFTRLSSLLKVDAVAVVGFCENDGGALYNSAIVLTAGSVIGVYRKTHLWDAEKLLFSPGPDSPTVFETPVGRLGVLICYDQEFPEMPRSLAVQGAEMIAIPTNWPAVPVPPGERPPEVIQAMAASRSSRIPIFCCDRRGAERGNTWTEGSVVINAEGWPSGTKDSNNRIDADIEIDDERVTIGPRNHVLKDRRPDLYGDLNPR